MLITNNKKYAFRAQLVRNHGEVVADEPILGNNYRLTEIQAAIASEQFKKLDKLNKQRIGLADYLTKKLQFDWLVPPKSNQVYYVYPIRFLGKNRRTFVKALKGFPIAEGYQKPLYLNPIYQKKQIYPHSRFPFISKEYPHKVSYQKGICPVAERMYEKELLTTTICQTNKKTIDLFIKAIYDFSKRR